MAQPGNFTPILLYSSSTSTNVPLAANLTNSTNGAELAINIADKNLFFKDSGGTVNTVPIRQSSTSSNGWLSSTDWNTFNNKGSGTVTSVTGTSPIVSSGGTTPAISLATAYGDTLNPYASKTANYILAAPNGSAGVPTFRALVAADLPSLSGTYIPYTGASSAIDLNAQTVTNIAHLGLNSTAVPDILLRAYGDNNSTSRIAIRGYSSNASSSSIRVAKFRGTFASPQAPLSGDSLGKFELAGYGTTSSSGYPQASYEGVATENWGATARGTKALFYVTPNTTITQAVALTIDQDKSATFASTVTATSFSGSGSSLTGVVTSVTGTSPVVSSGGTTPAISMPAATTSVSGYLTSTDWNTFNNKGSGTVTSVSGTTGRITSTGGTTPVIDLASGVATAGTTGSSTLIPVVTIDTYGRVTSITTASNPQGTVTSVTGTAPVVSSGGATPAISMAAATSSVNGYLTSTDWTTFNNKGSGTVTSVAALTLGTTGTDLSSTVTTGTTTPVITLNVPTASATNRGALSAADWSTFNGKAPGVTFTTGYVPYGQGTTTLNQSSNLFFDGTKLGIGTSSPSTYATLAVTNGSASNGIIAGFFPNATTINRGVALGTSAAGTASIYGWIPSTGAAADLVINPLAGALTYGSGQNSVTTTFSISGWAGLFQRWDSAISGRTNWGLSREYVAGGDMGFLRSSAANGTPDTTVLYLAPSGGVSIGNTTDPGATNLSVTGYTSSASFRPTSSTVPTNGLYLPTTNTLGLATNSAEIARISAAGNLSIGNTGFWATPSATRKYLGVYGSTDGAVVELGSVTATNGIGVFQINGANGGNYIGLIQCNSNAGSSTAGSLDFFTNSGSGLSNRLSLASTGVVTMGAYGVGTATFSAAGVISSVSDETWKTKDGVPTNPDEMLQKLEPGYWYYNEEKAPIFGTERQLGFYAQNVNEAIGNEAAPIPGTFIVKAKDGTETSVTKPWGYYDRSVLAVTVMSLKNALNTIQEMQMQIANLTKGNL